MDHQQSGNATWIFFFAYFTRCLIQPGRKSSYSRKLQVRLNPLIAIVGIEKMKKIFGTRIARRIKQSFCAQILVWCVVHIVYRWSLWKFKGIILSLLSISYSDVLLKGVAQAKMSLAQDFSIT